MEDMELICLQIISNAGEARSESVAALAAARNSRFDEAGEHLAAAGEKMKEAHHVHTRLITIWGWWLWLAVKGRLIRNRWYKRQ